MRKTSWLAFFVSLLPLFVFCLIGQSAFAQYACFGYAAGGVNDYHNCGIQGVGYSGTDSQGNVEAYAIQVWLGSASGGNVEASAQLTGDLGSVQQCGGPYQCPTLSFPCGNVVENSYNPNLVSLSAYSPGVHVVTATFTACDGTGDVWSATEVISITPLPPNLGPPPTPCSLSTPSLIDPVASNLLSGNSVVSNGSFIASGANSASYVSGAAADGVTQVLVQIPTGEAGDTVQLTLLNENGQQDSVANDGGLFPLGGSPGGAAGTLTVTSQGSASTPMAYAMYLAPSNYYRGTQDAATAARNLTLQATCVNSSGSPATASTTIQAVRPPVVLVHGLWSNASAWSSFVPDAPINVQLWNALFTARVNYDGTVSITGTSPSYPFSPTGVRGSALGFAYNAPIVLQQVGKKVSTFGKTRVVAAVQADVVAHSMGGDLARAMAALTAFANQSNYGMGPIHKLITIGTPYQGSPVAANLLPGPVLDPNECVRNVLSVFDDLSLQSATIGGNSPVDGAVGDLIQPSLPSSQLFRTAYIAGSTTSLNLAQLNSTFSSSQSVHLTCGTGLGDPLAIDLTPTAWNNVFAGTPNDGIVTVASQLNGSASALTFPGVIHSAGIESLNFLAPAELDTGSGIPDEVINLLNEPTSGSDFLP